MLLALSGCTALLDFSEPIGEGDDIDAGDGSIDATPGIDATAAVCLTFEPNDTRDDATPITPMVLASAACSATDTDLYSFVLAADLDVSITLTFTSDADHDLDLLLLNADGESVIESVGGGDTEQITRTKAELAPGTFFIEVKPTTVTDLAPYTLDLTLTPNAT